MSNSNKGQKMPFDKIISDELQTSCNGLSQTLPMGSSCQMASTTLKRSSRFDPGPILRATLCFMVSHICSIWLMSGLLGGYSVLPIPSWKKILNGENERYLRQQIRPHQSLITRAKVGYRIEARIETLLYS